MPSRAGESPVEPSAGCVVSAIPGTSADYFEEVLFGLDEPHVLLELDRVAFTDGAREVLSCERLVLVASDLGALRVWLPAIVSLPAAGTFALRVADGRGLVPRLPARHDELVAAPTRFHWQLDAD